MDGDGVAFEERRSGLWDQCGEGTIDGVHLIVEILGALGETPDRHVRCELDLVGTLTEPHRSSLRHEAGLVTMLEPGTDLIRATDHDLAQLVQRLEPLHACRTTGDHQHSHLLQRAITPLRRHAGSPDSAALAAASASIGSGFSNLRRACRSGRSAGPTWAG
jgi:hypothetical protein